LDPFKEIELFVQISESGSISKAAERLGLSVSAASRHLIALETRLGVRLVQRTTRQLSLTEVGTEFYRRSRSVLADLREAESVARDAVVKPSGLLRVTASLSFCLLHIEPLLPEFTRRYPEINVDIVAANRYLDVMENNVDVAIRTRQFEADNNLTIRRLA
jgi:DNA-binding transcriptional LysR family regulator